ncbi:N-acetylmuramoyl-L-alanine amidase [Romboutsia sp.]|uniref:N-acetylmuramoyl-L-alanine amidase n=1 Tax=Romboutsia sp. TaxID=1965302 RepID=UPI003F320C6D
MNKKFKSIALVFTMLGIIASSYTQVNASEHKVLIDPGHGGKDNGSSHNFYIEDQINLQIANKLRDALEKEGINVEMTREDDTYLSLSQRAAKSNKSYADIFISIHQNASVNPSANGVETYYMNDSNKELANYIHKNVLEETNAKDRNVRYGNLQVLRDNKKPSILLECGFISNKNEGYRLSTKAYQVKLVNGIAKGIKEYLNRNSTNSSVNNQYTLNNAVCLNNVKVMSDRGKSFDVLGTLEKGTKVEVIDTKFDWHKIKYNGRYGYVSSVYVK